MFFKVQKSVFINLLSSSSFCVQNRFEIQFPMKSMFAKFIHLIDDSANSKIVLNFSFAYLAVRQVQSAHTQHDEEKKLDLGADQLVDLFDLDPHATNSFKLIGSVVNLFKFVCDSKRKTTDFCFYLT